MQHTARLCRAQQVSLTVVTGLPSCSVLGLARILGLEEARGGPGPSPSAAHCHHGSSSCRCHRAPQPCATSWALLRWAAPTPGSQSRAPHRPSTALPGSPVGEAPAHRPSARYPFPTAPASSLSSSCNPLLHKSLPSSTALCGITV